MLTVGIVDVMLLITAVDDKIWALQKELDESNEDDEMYAYTEEEQVRYMTLAAKLKDAYTQSAGEYPDLEPYASMVRPGVPGQTQT